VTEESEHEMFYSKEGKVQAQNRFRIGSELILIRDGDPHHKVWSPIKPVRFIIHFLGILNLNRRAHETVQSQI